VRYCECVVPWACVMLGAATQRVDLHAMVTFQEESNTEMRPNIGEVGSFDVQRTRENYG